MKRIIIISSMFIGVSIMFSGALIAYKTELGSTDSMSWFVLFLGVLMLLIFSIMCKELYLEYLHSNDKSK